jgi:exosortase A-associated hydrolase 2
MIARLGRTLAAAGIFMCCVDPFGTGDSDGDFGDATWAQWRVDVRVAADWVLSSAGAPPDIVGIRSGALLALDALAEQVGSSGTYVLWAPTMSGRSFLTQFLRIQLAAAATLGEGPGAGTQELWHALERGARVEVAGYEISSDLAMPLAQLQLQVLLQRTRAPVSLIEVIPEGGASSGASRKLIERQASRGAPIAHSVVVGDPFWSTTEIVEVQSVIDVTLQRLVA